MSADAIWQTNELQQIATVGVKHMSLRVGKGNKDVGQVDKVPCGGGACTGNVESKG